MRKIYAFPTIVKKLASTRGQNRIVFFSGAFDLFHFAHYKALKTAASLGNTLIVQIDGNTLVKQRKGTDRPYLDERDRALILSSFEFVDLVFISNYPSENRETLSQIKPDIYVRAIRLKETAKERMIRERFIVSASPRTTIAWIPQTKEISTTKIGSLLPRRSLKGKKRTVFNLALYQAKRLT